MVFFVVREDCYNGLMGQGSLDLADCLKVTVSKTLGYLIVIGAVFFKLPQIIKIMKNRSVEGISKYSCYAETLMYLHTFSYCMH
mmetsp:Transcript_8231/g.7642  ORF Transcript_8231/g.7642 Transcript_8231/m.7642 type:complete len:84 (+) Transcript_8231:107-358(+)